VAKIDQLRLWKNNETFNARDYVYERDTIVASVNSAYDEKVEKAGDTMTGDLNMGTNDIIQDAGGFVNHTSFQNGDEITDAIKIEYLKNIFGITGTVTRETGESWLEAYVRVVNEKLDTFLTFANVPSRIDQQEDVLITTPSNREFLIFNGEKWINGNITIADVENLQIAINNLQNQINNKSDLTHGHPISDIINLQDALDERVNTGLLGTADGVATLDANAKVKLDQLPDSAKSQTFVQLSTDPRPTINILPGDKLYETDTGDSYIYKDETDGWVLLADADWQNVNLDWTNVTNTPTTLAGYGITDGATDTELSDGLATKSDVGHTHVETDITNLDKYTTNEVDGFLANKSDVGHTHTEVDITDLDKYTQIQVDNLLADKVDVGVLSSNIIIYPTVTESDVTGYVRGVTSTTDPDYPTTAVDVTTPIVNGVKVPVGTVIADANLFVGNPGVINVPIVGNVRSSANNVEAEFYFEIYKRDDTGTETLLGESTKTKTVTTLTYEEFNATALLNNGEFLATDRLVFKFFADKVGSVNGTFDFQYGGNSPVRILLNLPIDVTLQAERLSYDNTDSGLTATNVQDALDEIDTNLDTHIGDTSNPHSVTTTQIGAAEAVHSHALTDITGLMSNGKIDSALIPFQFDDVLQYADFASFPPTGEDGKLYIDLSTNELYRWDGSQYIVVKETLGALGEVPDVVLDNPQADEFLRYDGSNWVNDTVPIPDITTEFAAGVIETNNDSNLKFWRGTQSEFNSLTTEQTFFSNELSEGASVTIDIAPLTFDDVKNDLQIYYQFNTLIYDKGAYTSPWVEDATAPVGSVSVTDGTDGIYIIAGSGTNIEIHNTGTGIPGWKVDFSPTLDLNTEYIITDEATAPESISDLGDVNVGTITNNDGIANNTVLYYNETASEWQNKEIAKSDVGLSAVQNYGIANSSEAVDDTNNSKYMTPYTTHLAIRDIDVYNITLASGSWSGSSAPYTQTITTTGMTSNDYPFADIDLDGVSYGNLFIEEQLELIR